MRFQTFDGTIYRYRYDPVPYCGVYRLRKPIPPYNTRRVFIRDPIQDEEYRHFKDPKYKEMVSLYGGGAGIAIDTFAIGSATRTDAGKQAVSAGNSG